jgi:DHA2 family multidrug resistance protein-like MFS transporter
MTARAESQESLAPDKSKLVLISLILVAAVANLNLAVANVALPSIATSLDTSQTELNLVAVGYSVGLAASVLWLGALGDRYGRKMVLLAGTVLAIPASILAGVAGNVEVLIAARLLGGLAAGMAFPTTLALITALWSGPARTKAIALWSGVGGAIAALGPVISGALLEHFDWASVFIVTIPLAAMALLMALVFIPKHVNETTDSVDNFGGILSVIAVSTIVLAINFVSLPGETDLTLALTAIGLIALAAFVFRQRKAPNPLYDLDVAARRTFWVAACAGLIVFGSLMGAMFIGQQYLQNVLSYSTLDAGLAILPAAFCMVLVAPRSAKLVDAYGARFTLLGGYVFCVLGFVVMLFLWEDGASYWKVGLAYALIGVGVGLAGTPASHSLTGSVPVKRAGMASGTADLQRDLGGAIMQSIFGTLLTAGFASSMTAAIATFPNSGQINDTAQSALTKSFASAEAVAAQEPQYAEQIIAAAKTAFLQGDDEAYVAGIVAILIGAALVFFMYPKREQEQQMLAGFHAEDAKADVAASMAEHPAAGS